MKKDVLTVSVVKFDDNYSVTKIVHQDEEILSRGAFRDKSLKVYSNQSPSWEYGTLYLRGIKKSDDEKPFVILTSEVGLLFDLVWEINEKYGKGGQVIE
ncbi:hypothetical protein [Streptobacillus moniliformis]|uniref:hypothetical protein n=1 Tax=Streptobacillus moniliformis TaxID=34105 RepID=UPI0007E49881|nr:hypothetical protein [Streptobacillus moniliformis]